jgi:hypothetical protein
VLSAGPGARHCSPSKDLPVGKSLHVGNIDYRQLPGYRLESQNCWERSKLSGRVARLCPWWSVNFSFLRWNAEVDRPFGSAADARGKEFGRVWGGALFASREAEAQRRCRVTNPVSLPGVFENRGDVGGHPWASILRKLEVAKRATARGFTPGKRRCDIRASESYALESIEATIMNVRSRGFGQI